MELNRNFRNLSKIDYTYISEMALQIKIKDGHINK